VRTLRDENERLRRAAEGGGFRRVRQCVDEGALLGGLGVKPKPKPVVIKKWCEEIKVGTWMSGDGTVVFEPDIFHWVPPREVPGVGIVTLKMRTSSISQAVFDKRSNVLKVRGLVEVPMDKLVRYYDCFASPDSPKGYLWLTFQNYEEFTEVIKAVPRLKARITFRNSLFAATSRGGGSGGSSAEARRNAVEENSSTDEEEDLPLSRRLLSR